jgi:hypothetical protein
MNDQLSVLIAQTKAHKMTPKEIKHQRKSLVYRNNVGDWSEWELSGVETQPDLRRP